MTLLAWGNSAWAEGTIKTVNGTITTWDFTKVTEDMCAGLSSGNWTKCQDSQNNDVGFKSNANGGDESPAFLGGLTINTCGSDKSRIYYNGSGYCFNGGSAYIIIPVTEGQTLSVYSVQEIKSIDVTLTSSNGAYVAKIPTGKTAVKIIRNSGATYVTKIVLEDAPARTFTDFQIDFTKDWANATSIVDGQTYYITATTADGVPTMTTTDPATYLAKFKGKYHGNVYGVYSTTLTVPVDGPVKFTYGASDQGSTVTGKNTENKTVVEFSNYSSTGKWNNTDKIGVVGSKVYNSETPTTITLTIVNNKYVPYIKVEACDFVPLCEKPTATKGAYVAGTTSWTYTLATTTNDAHIKYTINGGEEQTISSVSGDVQIPYGATVEAWAVDPNGTLENSQKLQFTAAAQPQLAAPTIVYDDHYQITITRGDEIEGVKIYYTIDGSNPTAESTEYTAPFSISENKTIKAVAILAGYINSTIASQSIIIKAQKPIVQMSADRKKVTLTNNLSGGTVYYTTDGSTPTTDHYTGMFTSASYEIPLTSDCEIKAFTVKEGIPSSDVVTYYCRISFHDIDWDLTGNTPFLGTSKSDFETGVIVKDNGTTLLCDKNDPSASISLKTKWNDNSHGYNGWTAKIPVEGNVDIYLGNCQYGGGTMTIKTTTTADITLSQLGRTEPENCYHQDKTANVNSVHYIGGPTTLEITSSGAIYVPYFAVKDARRTSDLAIKNGKENINISVNEQYTLTKNVDFVGSAPSYTYTSSNPEVATVDADGKITAGANYGMTSITVSCTDATGAMKPGKIQFTVRVISAVGQTHKPSVTIGEDGSVNITKSDMEENSTFYYTLDGSTPTESSPTTTGNISAADANGKIVKVFATTNDKSPSDVVTAFVNVAGDIVWAWNEGSGNVEMAPTISESIQAALNSNTVAVVGNKFTSSWTAVTNKTYKFAAFKPEEKISSPHEQHAINFNIIPLIGIKFKPTAVSFEASRVGTDGGAIDTKFVCGTSEHELLTNVIPGRSNASSGPTYTTYTPDVSDIPASDNEWALKMYVYNLNNTASYAFSNVRISGTFTGIKYEGVFYSISASTNPAEGGTVHHIPTASKIPAGKDATFIATPSTGYRFTHWTYLDATESLGTDKTIVMPSVRENVELEAHFEKLPYITFECNNSSVQGSVPAAQYVNEDGTFFMPYNYTLFRPKAEGSPQRWSITAWTDGETVYELGQEYRFDKDTKLTPVLTATDKDITDITTKTVVRWNFDNKKDPHAAPTFEIDSSKSDNVFSYTKQVDIAGEKLDMKMVVDATSGKFTNADARVIGMDGFGAQVNNGAKFVIPAVDGMKVIVKASTKKDNLQTFNSQGDFADGSTVNITFGGNTGTRIDNKTLEYTYSGDATTLNVVFVEAGTKVKNGDRTGTWGFYEYIEVEYPVLPDVLMENRIVTTPLLSDKELAVNAGMVTKSATTHTNTGSRYKQGDNVTITAMAKYGYYISAIKSGETTLAMTKVEPSADATQPTKATATYTVGDTIGTVTVEYERLPMGKVRLEATDAKLGDVDFADSCIYENFYLKGDGWVESWFVVGKTETAVAIAADDYVMDKWAQKNGTQLVATNPYPFTVTSDAQTFYAHFKHGEMGSVTFDIANPVIIEGTEIKALPDNFGAKYDVNSQAPASVTNSYSFTIPKYHTVFKTGYTLKKWKDTTNGNTYDLGSNYSFKTSNQTITLVPVYEANPSDEANRINDPVMMYEFGTGKNIRAQQVKLEKNTTTFWTAQVYVVTIAGDVEYKHYRDVPLDVITGSNGFVRNGDMPEWASFGPGTTFNVASCSGTKVEILSYAPMTTTTFGGKLFTLVSHDEAKHEYVYECTTQSAAESVPIVIGDDYSYYKYIKVYSKKANRVNLHVDVDDKARGRMTTVEAVNTSVADPIIELEDGGNSFHQGNSVKLTFKRRFGFEFDKIVDLDKNITVLQMLDNGNVRMINSNTDTATTDVEGSTSQSVTTWTGSLFTLERTEASMEADSLRTQYELTFNITTHRNIQVCFKEKPTYYVTYNAGKLATGTAPAAAWVEAGDAYVVPENRTLYYEGNTLKYWIDANYDKTKTLEENTSNQHVYQIGQSYHNPGSDILLYPVFEKNTFGLLDIPSGDGLKVTWPFAKNLGAPTVNFERSAGILVSQLKKSETEWIDLKIDLDGSTRKDANGNNIYGKFNNTASDDRCQINNNSILTFPTTKDCVIGLSALKEISTTLIAGMTDGNGYTKGREVTATYTGEEASKTVNFAGDGSYYTKFEVTYKPQLATKPTLASVKYGDTELDANQLNSLTGDSRSVNVSVTPDIVNDALPVVTATANNGVVTVTQADINNRSAIITLKTQGGVIVETYSVNFTFNTTDVAAPQFIKYIVNGVEYTEGQREITIDNAPVSGTITLRFDHTMAAMSVTSPVYQTTYSAPQGRDLVFHYWNLPVGTESNLQFPASIFKDVYGMAVVDTDNSESYFVNIHLKVSSTSMPVQHKTFDYIVGKDGDVNDAIAAANAASGSERFYIYIPDGEYELRGNQEITSAITSDGVAPADSTGVRRTDLIGQTFNNGMTQITRANVSLIGQSTKGVTLYNRPLLEGIGYTATIHVGKNATDFYAEDLQLVNRFPYWKSLNSQGSSGAGRAVAFWDQGNRSIMKNVELWSYQDTYYSSNANDDYRGYFENCTIAGVVDWLCGDGNIWLEKCDIVIRDRAGNNISAPSQETTQLWGYVFNECNIKPEVENPKDLKDKNWSLARPWASSADKSPAATFLNTKMWLLPRDAGWEKMGTGAILRFHEYHSMDKGGNLISLGARSLAACAPGAGSDDCILSAADAAKYTVENVLGGSDAFTPRVLTQQIDATDADAAEKDANNSLVWDANLHTDDDRLVWNVHNMALCYFIFKKDEVTGKWKYVTNVAQTEQGSTMSTSVEQYGTGDYCLRAANQRGGLGAATAPIKFTVSSKYTLEIKQVGETPGYGWSTLCLPYNANKPTQNTDGVDVTNTLKIYSGECKSGQTSINDYEMVLKPVEVLSAEKGYVVYGPVGKYVFSSTSHPASDAGNILKGNSSDNDILTGNNNCYVLANKTYGLGFYKYTGATLAAHRAWLPVGKVSSSVTSNSAKAIKFVFQDEFGNTTAIGEITADGRYEFHKAEIYDLNGIRIQTPVRGRVYIINGEKRQWK